MLRGVASDGLTESLSQQIIRKIILNSDPNDYFSNKGIIAVQVS